MAEAEQRIHDQSDKTGQTEQTGQISQDKTGQTNISTSLAPFNELLNKAWKVYRLKLKSLLGIEIISALAAIAIIAILLIGGALLAALAAVVGKSFTVVVIILGIILALLAIVALFYLSFWSQVTLLYNACSEEPIGAIESYKKTRNRIGGFAWIAIFSGLISLCGFFLFVIPGIIFSIWFSFAAIVFLFENEKGMSALLKSREYVRGKWWGIMFRLWAMAGLFVLLSWLFSALGAGLKAANAPQMIMFFADFIQSAASFILAPLQIVFLYYVFKDLKNLKKDSALTPSKNTRTTVIISIVLGIIVLIALVAISILGAVALSRSGIDLGSLLQTK
jgi:MFS family permease